MNLNLKSNEDRPVFLVVLCVLSWVQIGFNFIATAYQFVSGPLADSQIKASQVDLKAMIGELRNAGVHYFAEVFEKIGSMTQVLNDHHYSALGLTLLSLAIGFVGVSLMFVGRKIGFHLYIIYSLISVGQIYLFFSAEEIPSIMTWFGISISALFIGMYAMNVKWMK